MAKFRKIKQLFLENKSIIFIVFAATFLRTWLLTSHLIFFGDAAHDLLMAQRALANHTVPLLGIESSVPRFHQGPLTIWFEMIVSVFAGKNVLVDGVFFALLSILAVIFLYEILVVHVNKNVALCAAVVLAFSPFAVAQGRMPYHTNPIPLFLIIYVYTLVRLSLKRKHGLFWAVLGFCLLFQFELAMTPLVLLIPYILYRKKRHHIWTKKEVLRGVKASFLAVLIGLFPQLLYDVTHQFSHLGGFAVWIVYRIVSFFGYKEQHAFSLEKFAYTLSFFEKYISRIWSVDVWWVALFTAVFFVFGCAVTIQLWRKKKLPFLIEFLFVGMCLQTVAYFVHGSPSEAYFPPFLIFTSVFIGVACDQIVQRWQHGKLLVIIFMALYILGNTFGIFQNNFFVSTTQAFNYGPSIDEQKNVTAQAWRLSGGDLHFMTTVEDGKFPNYFDNLRWILAEKNLQENQSTGLPFYVETKNSPLQSSPNYFRLRFKTLDLYWQL